MQIDAAELVGLAVEGAMYGFFLCLFCVCGYDLIRRRARVGSQLSWPMLVAGMLLIVLATARFVVDTTNVFVAFIQHGPRSARIAYLADVTQTLFITRHSLLIAALLVGDSFLNYRCWVVWGKRLWIVLFPIGLSLTSAAVGSYTMWAFNNLPNQTTLFEDKWLKAFSALSLVANAVPTLMLAFRIWSIDRRMSYTTDLGGSRFVRIVFDSGILNIVYLFIYVMALNLGSQGLEIVSGMAVPFTGIIFFIVILRVGRQRYDDVHYTERPLSWSAKGSRGCSGPTATTLSAGTRMPLEVYMQKSSSSASKQDLALQPLSSMTFSNAP
ncbi:hypothetical protein BC628DRAFT_1321404 [Trametes gibbosa]|nr:hypothetical protein BC628DRAFT_1321404 [Trametes gibbosa]